MLDDIRHQATPYIELNHTLGSHNVSPSPS